MRLRSIVVAAAAAALLASTAACAADANNGGNPAPAADTTTSAPAAAPDPATTPAPAAAPTTGTCQAQATLDVKDINGKAVTDKAIDGNKGVRLSATASGLPDDCWLAVVDRADNGYYYLVHIGRQSASSFSNVIDRPMGGRGDTNVPIEVMLLSTNEQGADDLRAFDDKGAAKLPPGCTVLQTVTVHVTRN